MVSSGVVASGVDSSGVDSSGVDSSGVVSSGVVSSGSTAVAENLMPAMVMLPECVVVASLQPESMNRYRKAASPENSVVRV